VFQKLFRQDLLLASLFRNFLLAERVMHSLNCTPVSHPPLPSTRQHPLWASWDLAVEICLSQLFPVNVFSHVEKAPSSPPSPVWLASQLPPPLDIPAAATAAQLQQAQGGGVPQVHGFEVGQRVMHHMRGIGVVVPVADGEDDKRVHVTYEQDGKTHRYDETSLASGRLVPVGQPPAALQPQPGETAAPPVDPQQAYNQQRQQQYNQQMFLMQQQQAQKEEQQKHHAKQMALLQQQQLVAQQQLRQQQGAQLVRPGQIGGHRNYQGPSALSQVHARVAQAHQERGGTATPEDESVLAQGLPSSSFFTEQLTAFEVWLQFGGCDGGHAGGHDGSCGPEQLPIVLQVLLSQVHRLRALELLKRFVDLGPWACNRALTVGIFPYVLKLLASPAVELRQVG
jgi:hypothetical protein